MRETGLEEVCRLSRLNMYCLGHHLQTVCGVKVKLKIILHTFVPRQDSNGYFRMSLNYSSLPPMLLIICHPCAEAVWSRRLS
jgi:hypothetical protein